MSNTRPRLTISSLPATVVELAPTRILVTPAEETIQLVTVAEKGPPGPVGTQGEKGEPGGFDGEVTINGGYF